ncbi:hypothetical protein [Streptomyces himalayensis]|uniref:Uncharacterized protein n=1 Tax=Streptomyces himalayensis subsp. himalayensis TaxID=2756131 RepID=A0A7W0IDT4_9ACTN|nr:hypothetical protein [Streptomyces himalayensis]MBA2951647.1 hypothetical protein [Streptomyces himalayensis subsp. himalayensis]
MSIDNIPFGQPLTAREFFSLLDPNAKPFIPELDDSNDLPEPAELEQQISELRAHALQHLAERGTAPTPEHWDQWHEFLDIDPDLRGRDYSKPGSAS